MAYAGMYHHATDCRLFFATNDNSYKEVSLRLLLSALPITYQSLGQIKVRREHRLARIFAKPELVNLFWSHFLNRGETQFTERSHCLLWQNPASAKPGAVKCTVANASLLNRFVIAHHLNNHSICRRGDKFRVGKIKKFVRQFFEGIKFIRSEAFSATLNESVDKFIQRPLTKQLLEIRHTCHHSFERFAT